MISFKVSRPAVHAPVGACDQCACACVCVCVHACVLRACLRACLSVCSALTVHVGVLVGVWACVRACVYSRLVFTRSVRVGDRTWFSVPVCDILDGERGIEECGGAGECEMGTIWLCTSWPSGVL